MQKKQYLDLKIGLSFAISTGMFLILGLYILIAIQPIIDYSKLATLETSEAIGNCANIISALKDTTTSFHHYEATRDVSFYKKTLKNLARLNIVLENIKKLDENSLTLKILHKKLPSLLNSITNYEKTINNACTYLQEFEENIPKLSFLINNTINEVHKFLSIPQDYIRSSGGKDAESLNIILKLNQIIYNALITRGEFWKGVSTQDTKVFQACIKTLKDSITILEEMEKKNTVPAFKAPLESFIFSIKNMENALTAVITNYTNFIIEQQKHCDFVDEVSDILNSIIKHNIDKMSSESQRIVQSLNQIKYVVLIVITIGVMFANTMGIIIARQANKREGEKSTKR